MATFQEKLKEIIDDEETAIKAALLEQAVELAPLIARATRAELIEAGRTGFTRSVFDGITTKIETDYRKELSKGGTTCAEKIIEPLGNGKVKVYMKPKFVPWIDDLAKEQQQAVIDIVTEGNKIGLHPLNQSKQIADYFEGTRHRSVTSARTESLKIRTDSIVESYLKSGIKYLHYITAGDDRVRPDHAARDGKIYRIEDAPYMGDYNCRCVLTDAMYLVENEGRKVEPDGGIVVDAELME